MILVVLNRSNSLSALQGSGDERSSKSFESGSLKVVSACGERKMSKSDPF